MRDLVWLDQNNNMVMEWSPLVPELIELSLSQDRLATTVLRQAETQLYLGGVTWGPPLGANHGPTMESAWLALLLGRRPLPAVVPERPERSSLPVSPGEP